MKRPLKKRYALLLTFLCGAFVAFAALDYSLTSAAEPEPSEVTGPANLLIEQKSFSFGSVLQGTAVEHEFRIQNVGEGPLKIDRVHPACGCTAILLQSQEIPAGGETSLKVTFDTSGFYGQKVKTIRLYSNDPKQASVVLTIQGEIRRDVEIDPPRLYFGLVTKGSESKLNGSIVVDEVEKVKVTDIRSRNSAFSVQKTIQKNGKRAEFSVTLANTLPVGELRDRVVVLTTSKSNPVIHIPVYAKVKGDLELDPQELSFGLMQGPLIEAKSATVRLVNSGEREIELLKVESDNSALQVTQRNLDEGRVYELRVDVVPGTTGILRGKIRITTNHPDPDQQVLELPVYGIISRKPA